MEDLVKELTIDMVPDGDNRIIAETIGVENYYKLCSVVGARPSTSRSRRVSFALSETLTSKRSSTATTTPSSPASTA